MTNPARILPAPTVLIDHAEQLPWAPFVVLKGESWLLPVKRAHLGTGDYAIEGHETVARIERKAKDLYGTLFGSVANALGEASHNQDRFRREMMRFRDPAILAPGAFMGIWVEGTEYDLLTRSGPHKESFRSKEPWEAYNLLMSLQDYGIPIRFVGTPRAASLALGSAFRRIWTQATDPKAQKKARRRGIDCLMPWIAEGGAGLDPGGECCYCGTSPRVVVTCIWCGDGDTGGACEHCGPREDEAKTEGEAAA